MDRRREFQDYLNFLLKAGSRADDVVDVPKDYPDHLKAGVEYADLVQTAGFKRLISDLELRADRSLAALRDCRSHNPTVILGLRSRWTEAEDSLKFIQIRAAEAIEMRKAIIADLGLRFGIVDSGVDGEGSGLDLDTTADAQHMAELLNVPWAATPEDLDDNY